MIFSMSLSFNRASNYLIQDFCNSSSFKNHPLFSNDHDALQIIAYYDELGDTNPIGSYVHTHSDVCSFPWEISDHSTDPLFTLWLLPNLRILLDMGSFVLCTGP